jgi:predicted ATP-binding protein involved in virulence
MRLKEVDIHNFRGIENCHLQFHDGMNLIIGKNGVGKTSILEAIAVGLGGFISGLDGVSTRNFTQDEIRVQYAKTGDGSYNQKFILPIEVCCRAKFNGKPYEWKRAREAYSSSRTGFLPRQIAKDANEQAGTDDAVLPLISYQSASRTWMQKRDSKAESTGAKSARTYGYQDCLSTVSSRKQIIAWCEKMAKTAGKEEMGKG